MDFVDWCTHVLNTLINALKEPNNARKGYLDERRLFKRIFGEDTPFEKSPQRDAMRDALRELGKERLVEERSNGNHWRPTREGVVAAMDMTPLWRDICGIEIATHEEELLRFVNDHSQRTKDGTDYVWLEWLSTNDLMSASGSEDREAIYYRFHQIADDLKGLGLVEMNALSGYHLNLKATYQGIVWETRRRLLQQCDIFISHITEESNLAQKFKGFLKNAFDDDLKIFVSSDYDSIGGGEFWFLEIIKNIKAAPIVLVLLSEASVNRRWINFEAGVGIGSGGRVIPLVASGFTKNEVGPPLSHLQVRSLADSKDVEGVLNDIAKHLKRSQTDVDAAAFVAEGSAVGGSKLEASINHVPVKAYEGYEEHSLIIGLVNNSTKTLIDFRVELEVPNVFLNQSTSYAIEVEGRRTEAYRFFRSEGKNHNIKTLRPGDVYRSFIKIDLIISPGLIESDALDQEIIVKVFSGDAMTQKIERTVREILAQQPSFG